MMLVKMDMKSCKVKLVGETHNFIVDQCALHAKVKVTKSCERALIKELDLVLMFVPGPS
jgi:hypothetical protein